MIEGGGIKRDLKLARLGHETLTSTANNDSKVASKRNITLGNVPQFPF